MGALVGAAAAPHLPSRQTCAGTSRASRPAWRRRAPRCAQRAGTGLARAPPAAATPRHQRRAANRAGSRDGSRDAPRSGAVRPPAAAAPPPRAAPPAVPRAAPTRRATSPPGPRDAPARERARRRRLGRLRARGVR
eukprot:1604387-Prymnesium_polylepis.1